AGALVALRYTLLPRPGAPAPGSVALAVGSSAHPPLLQSLATSPSDEPVAIGSSPAHPAALRSPLACARFVLPCSSSCSCSRLPLDFFPILPSPLSPVPPSCKNLARTPPLT